MTEMYQRIAEECQKHNINGTQLASLLGLKKSPMTDWKNDKSNPTVDQLAKMCEIFAVSADYLISGYEHTLTAGQHEGLLNRIKYLCEINNTKLRPLEEELGLGNGTISQWANSSPSCDNILKIATYFNVSVDWLLTGREGKFDISEEKVKLLNSFEHLTEYDKCEILEIIQLKIRLRDLH